MTRIAVHTVVDIAIDSAVPGVSCRRCMTTGAGEDGVIRRVGMACGANPIGVAMVDGEERVIGRRQGRRQPRCCSVAGCASRRPARRCMVRIRGSRVVGLMA